ncbi:CDF-like metal transporter [Cantharellus anzutake]|uniref:CDF-like metal transporter n=1 Tax=Cantharellus anzutake TaxID=1750568 RepID=UPI00190791EF|nr:CDF-like metal transporter [Cantharellus anzutake]KAF8343034.1 CDF-like metal transporter [Cantharellus anzutake]
MSIQLQNVWTKDIRAPSINEEHRLPSPAPSDDGGRDPENRGSKDLPDDPYMLRSAVKSNSEIQELRRSKNGKVVGEYHEKQNLLINSLLKPMEEHTEDAKAAEEAARFSVKIAVYTSLFANLALCVIQLYAAASSLSLSLLATGIDSVFDLGSNVLLNYLHKKASRLDVAKWPVGGSRLETIGNIVYGAMGSVNLVVIVESLRTIISHKDGETNAFHLPSIIAVTAALAVKFLLFVYCLPLRKSSSQVQILWEDHRNDVFINTFGVLMSSGGSKLRWWLDPTGGLLIAGGVIFSWSRTIWNEFELLAGKSASHGFIQLVTYKAATFSSEIEKVDTVRAYHSGPGYVVEVDIVMSAETPLWKAHDISQVLQDKLEVLPGVERAYVHVDHETTHAPEHRKHL